MRQRDVAEHGDLLHAQLRMLRRNRGPRLVFQWIEHRVMRMNTRQPFLVQLIVHNRHQPLHPVVIVGPVADDLQAVRQIAEGVREIWFQLQRRRVALYRFGNVPRILNALLAHDRSVADAHLVDARQIAVRVSERRVYVDRTCVALHRVLNISKFLECVAHVRVGIGEGGRYPNRLLNQGISILQVTAHFGSRIE